MICSRHGLLHHALHLRQGQRLGQNLPRCRRLKVHRRIVPDPFIQQQPLIETAQAGELARNRARLHPMPLQVLKEPCHLGLVGGHRQRVRTVEVFREEAQVPVIGLAGERPQSLLHPQVGKVLAQDPGMAAGEHNSIICFQRTRPVQASLRRNQERQPRLRSPAVYAGSAKLRQIAANRRGHMPRQERPSALTTSKSGSNTSLSPQEFVDAVLSREPAVAVFDCDGTLWSGDSGYDFMVWSIEEGIVSRNASDWIDSRYRLYLAGKVSEHVMCGEMVQIYDGVSEAEIRRAAASFFQSRFLDKIFPEMQ